LVRAGSRFNIEDKLTPGSANVLKAAEKLSTSGLAQARISLRIVSGPTEALPARNRNEIAEEARPHRRQA
jgi:hypothetical protein